jgi:hypothetical protein
VTLPQPLNVAICTGLACIGVAAIAAQSSLDGPVIALGATLALLPLLALLAARQPVAAVGVFVGGQILEAFEYTTGLGTLSFGVVLLALLLVFHWRSLWDAFRQERHLRIAAVLFGVWVASYLLRLHYAAPQTVARLIITALSFGAIAAAGVIVGRRRGAVGSIGIGATAALIALGVCGALASIGVIPEPDRFGGAGRDLLGITSPFDRNYGLNVPFDSVALLTPLAIPWLMLLVVSLRGRTRVAAGLALLLVLLAAVFVFQAREMLVQTALAVVLVVFVIRPRIGALFALVVLPLIVVAVIALAGVDQTSADIRVANVEYVGETLLEDPGRFLLGTDENAFFIESTANSPKLIAAIQSADFTDNAIHNFFLSNLVAGGILAFAACSAFFLWVLLRAVKLWRADARRFETRVLLVASGLMIVTLMIQPVRANTAGNWLLAGTILGFTAAAARARDGGASVLPHG